jgi:hypothetical protein
MSPGEGEIETEYNAFTLGANLKKWTLEISAGKSAEEYTIQNSYLIESLFLPSETIYGYEQSEEKTDVIEIKLKYNLHKVLSLGCAYQFRDAEGEIKGYVDEPGTLTREYSDEYEYSDHQLRVLGELFYTFTLLQHQKSGLYFSPRSSLSGIYQVSGNREGQLSDQGTTASSGFFLFVPPYSSERDNKMLYRADLSGQLFYVFHDILTLVIEGGFIYQDYFSPEERDYASQGLFARGGIKIDW